MVPKALVTPNLEIKKVIHVFHGLQKEFFPILLPKASEYIKTKISNTSIVVELIHDYLFTAV